MTIQNYRRYPWANEDICHIIAAARRPGHHPDAEPWAEQRCLLPTHVPADAAQRFARNPQVGGNRAQGHALIQIGKSPHKLLVARLGRVAEGGIEVAEAVRRVAPGGVDLLFDGASGDTLAHSLAVLRPHGRLVSVLNDGQNLALPAGVQFTHLFARLSVPDLEHLRELAEAGQLRVPVGHTFPLDDIRAAFEQLESKHTTGKIVIGP